MIEFGYYAKNGENRPILRDEIQFIENEDDEILISNYALKNSKIVAKEIDFYIKNSSEDAIELANNVNILYEARALAFDYAKDVSKSKQIGKNIIIISDENEDILSQKLTDLGFKVIYTTHSEIKFLYGQIGEIYVDMLTQNDEFEVSCDIVLIKKAKPYMLRQSGCFEIINLSDNEILSICKNISPVFEYRNFITYDEKICEFHHRRSEICAKCVDVCESVAILKDVEKKELIFSDIDCKKCGKCVSICPTSAIDFSLIPRESFSEIANLYKDKIVLMLDEKSDLSQNISLPKSVLPLMVERFGFFDFAHFMTLLSKTARSFVIYAQNSFIHTDSVDFINEIFMRKFGKRAIFVVNNLDELNRTFVEISDFEIESSPFLSGLKRTDFSNRLKHLVQNDDLGVITTPQTIHYGEISVNEDSCTLCLSCAGACNTGALIADSNDNSLKFNSSLCVACGYCVKSCAEADTILLKSGEIALNPQFFEHKILAKDELFKCVECGKEFATKKSIDKIAQMMKNHFKNDEIKMKTIFCCPECKAKLMINQQYEAQKRM